MIGGRGPETAHRGEREALPRGERARRTDARRLRAWPRSGVGVRMRRRDVLREDRGHAGRVPRGSSHDDWFVIKPGHEKRDVERIVRERDAFLVVEKDGL